MGSFLTGPFLRRCLGLLLSSAFRRRNLRLIVANGTWPSFFSWVGCRMLYCSVVGKTKNVSFLLVKDFKVSFTVEVPFCCYSWRELVPSHSGFLQLQEVTVRFCSQRFLGMWLFTAGTHHTTLGGNLHFRVRRGLGWRTRTGSVAALPVVIVSWRKSRTSGLLDAAHITSFWSGPSNVWGFG